MAEHLHYSREDTAWAFKEPTFQKSRDEDIDNTGQCAEPCNSYGMKVRLDPHRVTERTFAGLKSALCFKWVANKGLLCIAGNSAQRNVSAWMGGELGEECSLVAKSCPTLLRPHGSSVCGILWARILERVAISSSKGSFQPRDQTRISYIVGGYFA